MDDEICKKCVDWIPNDHNYDNGPYCMCYDHDGYEWDGKTERPKTDCPHFDERGNERLTGDDL